MNARMPLLRGSRWVLAQICGNRRRLATCGAAVLAAGVGYHVIFGQNGITVYRQKMQDARTLERTVRDLERQNEALKGHVERLADDPGAIEHQAREELHYTRPGEVIFALPEKPASRL